MDEQELRELVNPVFNTAKSCVQLDAATGDKDSQLLLDALGFEPFGTRVENASVSKELAEQVKRLFPAYAILVETRFQSMNRLIERREDSTVVDLPCGYTSRGIRLSRQGRTYFGFDLPAVTDVVGPAVGSIIGASDAVAYYGVDATNYESLEAPFADDDQNLLVTTEGLLMYFDQTELEVVFSNMLRLLQKHGGSWITTDRAYFLHDHEVVAAALNNDPQLTSLFAAVTKRAASTTADVEFNNNVFFDPDDGKVREFIAKMGFELRELCMADYLPEQIASLAGSPEADAAVRAVFQKMMMWELVVAKGADSQPASTGLPFAVESEVKDGVFEARVQGRLDTITAPELLKRFQDAGGRFEAIRIDVSQLEYVSSAGLRVLLMMCKSLGDMGRFQMTGAREEVRKILEMTGVDKLLLG